VTPIEEQLAKQAIVELVYHYAHAIDRRDCDLLERLFTPDVPPPHYGLFDGPVATLIAHRCAHGSDFVLTHHLTSNILVRVEGDRARAILSVGRPPLPARRSRAGRRCPCPLSRPSGIS
jgi:hypothetical protein